jgi:hypothetical protein
VFWVALPFRMSREVKGYYKSVASVWCCLLCTNLSVAWTAYDKARAYTTVVVTSRHCPPPPLPHAHDKQLRKYSNYVTDAILLITILICSASFT